MSTYRELQDEVLAYGFDANQYRSRVQKWINEAQARIARQTRLFDLLTTSEFTTTSGTFSYSLPATFVRADALRDVTNDRKLDYMASADELFDLYGFDAAGTTSQVQMTGFPESYTVTGSLIIGPIPNGSYTLELSYWSRPVDLSADADVSTLPADYHDLMVSYALQRAYRSEDDAQMAQFYRTEFNTGLQELRADRQFNANDGPRFIRGVWG